jgi:outer membrane protein assembly factor BamB
MKKLFYIVSILVIAAGIFTCCNKSEPPVPTNKALKLLWDSPIIGGTDDYKRIDIDDDVIFENGIILSHFENGKRGLKMIDTETKEVRWTWTDDIPLAFRIENTYQYNNYLICTIQNRMYCIDLKTGKTVFSRSQNFNFDSWVSGIGNTFYASSYISGFDADLFQGKVANGEDIGKYLTPKYKRDKVEFTPTRIIYKTTSIIKNNDTLLVVPFIEDKKNRYTYPQLGVYSTQKKDWLYNIDLVEDNNFYKTMPHGVRIYNDKVYIACGNDLICYELMTGKEIWRRNDFFHAFAFAFHGFEIYEGKLVACTEEGKLYCINAETGQNIWTLEKVSSGSSYVRYHNGVIYYLGKKGLTAVDINSGETLASVSPVGYLQDRIVVVPQPNGEKAKVIIFSYENMYVYEALK